MDSFYTGSARTLQGKTVDFEQFRGKVVLVVNTASKCGFTPHYKGLEELYKRYKDAGLVILGFPCNQFGKQEPGSSKEIAEGCLINYGVSFPIFEKIEVNGTGTDPFFRFLKKRLPGILGERIHWNFTKFLINREGIPLRRFAPFTTPKQIESFILREINALESTV